jgi:UDP-3-O-[3-hydroxymyristoyl] glucosamine N-acyltransferase
MTLQTILTVRKLADSLQVPLPPGPVNEFQSFDGVAPLEAAVAGQISFAATDELAAAAAASKASLVLCPQKGSEKFLQAIHAAGSSAMTLPFPTSGAR